eukprot:scaffold293700_cov49-Attheya_sp.AAC.1
MATNTRSLMDLRKRRRRPPAPNNTRICYFLVLHGILAILLIAPMEAFQFVHQPLHRTNAFFSNRRLGSQLWVSTSSTPTSKSHGEDDQPSGDVIWQKVVRPPSKSSVLFLAELVTYLQDTFAVPSNLPMVYEKQPPPGEESNGIVVTLTSPLGENDLHVEVVGIYPEEDTQSAPTMALVAVRKPPSPSSENRNVMLQQLWDESERQLLRALDGGLDDYTSGKIPASTKKNVHTWKEAMLAEAEGGNDDISTLTPDNFIDANFETSDPPTSNSEIQVENVPESQEMTQPKIPSTIEQESATRKSRAEGSSGGNFAVEAARKAAKQVERIPIEEVVTVESDSSDVKEERINLQDYAVEAAKKVAALREQQQAQNQPIEPEFPIDALSVLGLNSAEQLNRPVFKTTISKPKTGTKTKIQANGKEPPTVVDATTAQGRDFTAEELAEDVMTFGEEQEKNDAEGSGFVSAALETAKTLIREEKTKQKVDVMDRRKVSTEEEELKKIFEAGRQAVEGRLATAAQELEEESRSTKTSLESARKNGGVTEEDIDRLIESDKTVSRYARSLDDELAELEIRINKSPGEELDGPMKNPMFDIMSGPEAYNPNVDAETAVNWPGAQRGTKDVRLPKQLQEAIQQAKFAARTLSQLKSLDTDGEKGEARYRVGNKEISAQQVRMLRKVVDDAVAIGIIDDPLTYLKEQSRLQMVLDELNGSMERFDEIASNYKDLLLSDNFVPLIKERLTAMADKDLAAKNLGQEDLFEKVHAEEREMLGRLVEYAQMLLKEARALGAELEASQLEVIRSICQVAMDPSHKTEQDTAIALTDAVRDMRPLLDDAFVAYLKYAIAEEQGKLARAGVLDDPEYNRWMFVLKIVQDGVYAELSKGLNRHIEHIWYVLRMETNSERRELLEELVNVMPTLDVRPFVKVVDNIVASLGQGAKGDFDDAEPLSPNDEHVLYKNNHSCVSNDFLAVAIIRWRALISTKLQIPTSLPANILCFVFFLCNIFPIISRTNKLLQLHSDVKDILPPERIKLMSKDADEWASQQRERLAEGRKISTQRLKAAKDTENIDYEPEDYPGRRGEVERFT